MNYVGAHYSSAELNFETDWLNVADANGRIDVGIEITQGPTQGGDDIIDLTGADSQRGSLIQM